MRSDLRSLRERIRQVEAGGHRDTPLRWAYNRKLRAHRSLRGGGGLPNEEEFNALNEKVNTHTLVLKEQAKIIKENTKHIEGRIGLITENLVGQIKQNRSDIVAIREMATANTDLINRSTKLFHSHDEKMEKMLKLMEKTKMADVFKLMQKMTQFLEA